VRGKKKKKQAMEAAQEALLVAAFRVELTPSDADDFDEIVETWEACADAYEVFGADFGVEDGYGIWVRDEACGHFRTDYCPLCDSVYTDSMLAEFMEARGFSTFQELMQFQLEVRTRILAGTPSPKDLMEAGYEWEAEAGARFGDVLTSYVHALKAYEALGGETGRCGECGLRSLEELDCPMCVKDFDEDL